MTRRPPRKPRRKTHAGPLFLTPAELVQLTGRKHKDAQIRVLRARRIKFTTDADDRPQVTRSAVAGGQAPAPKREPNVEGLRRALRATKNPYDLGATAPEYPGE